MKTFAVCNVALLSAGVLLAAQLNVPQLGAARYADGSVHLIRGIGANMIVEKQRFATADVLSFSDSVGLLSSSGLIQVLSAAGTVLGEYQTDELSPLLHVDPASASGIVWLPSKHLLLRWDGAHFSATVVDDSSFGGTVSFVNLLSNTVAQFFVTRPDLSIARVAVALPSGRVTSADTEPAAHGWIFVQQGWTLSPDEGGLIAEKGNGARETVQLSGKALPPEDLRVEQMSSHWLHVSSRSTSTSWAVYLDQNEVNIFLLPPPAREVNR